MVKAILANWPAWSIQVLILSAVGYLAPRLLRITDPKSRVLGAQVALLACLLLPFAMPRGAATGKVSTEAAKDSLGPFPGRRVPAKPVSKWGFVIPGLMAAGVLIRLSGLAAGLWKLRAFRRSSQTLHPLPETVDQAFALTNTYCRVALTEQAHSPATFGLVRPIVLLPEKFMALSRESQLAILCHELLHVKRNDWLAALLEELCGALLWFQPAAYMLIADIRLAREQLVDRQVVDITEAKTPYLEALLAVASEPFGAAIAMAPMFLHRRNLKSRVTFLLEELYMSKTKMLFANVSLAALLGTAGWVSSISFPLVAVAQEKSAQEKSAKSEANSSWDFAKVFPPATGPRIRVGGNAAAANMVSQVKPTYPPDAKNARVQGTVKLGVLISPEGNVIDVVLISGDPLLVPTSIDTVKQWVYRPTLLNGNPVEVVTVVDVNYTLAQ
jgi:TonB family protein